MGRLNPAILAIPLLGGLDKRNILIVRVSSKTLGVNDRSEYGFICENRIQ